MRILALLFAGLALAPLGCTTSGSGTSVCTALVPDAGALACDIAWSCDEAITLYELACASESGAFKCTCNVDGVASGSFAVSPFECTAAVALNTATSGCGWSITIKEQ